MLLFLGGTLVAAFNSIIPILWCPAYILNEARGTEIRSSDPREARRSFRWLFAAICVISGLSPVVHLVGGLSVLDMIILFPAWNGVFGLPISAALLFWAINDEATMEEYTNNRWLTAVNSVLVVLALILAVLSAQDVISALLNGGV